MRRVNRKRQEVIMQNYSNKDYASVEHTMNLRRDAMPEKIRCPLCGKRIFDTTNQANVEIVIKCPHCHNVVKILLNIKIIK